MIVKVQISLAGNTEFKQILIYNKSKEIMIQVDATEELVKKFENKSKSFWQAGINKETKELEIYNEAPWQNW